MNSVGATVDELLQLAREEIARNSLSLAEKTLEQAVLINNQVAEAFYLLGHVYSKKGKFKKAIISFERALSIDSLHTEAAIALSSLYNDVGRYKDAAQVYHKTKRRLDRTSPGHDPRINESLARRHHELACLYLRYERFIEAKEEYQKALKLEPHNIYYSIQIAKCFAKSGDRDLAIQQLKKALESHPKSIEAKVQLGILYHAGQKLGDAHREWQEALALDPDDKSAQMYLSMLEYEPDSRMDQ